MSTGSLVNQDSIPAPVVDPSDSSDPGYRSSKGKEHCVISFVRCIMLTTCLGYYQSLPGVGGQSQDLSLLMILKAYLVGIL